MVRRVGRIDKGRIVLMTKTILIKTLDEIQYSLDDLIDDYDNGLNEWSRETLDNAIHEIIKVVKVLEE